MISPCPYLNPWAFLCTFLPLSSWGGQRQSSFGGHLSSNQGQPTTPCSSQMKPWYRKPWFSVTWVCGSMCLLFVLPRDCGKNTSRIHRDWRTLTVIISLISKQSLKEKIHINITITHIKKEILYYWKLIKKIRKNWEYALWKQAKLLSSTSGVESVFAYFFATFPTIWPDGMVCPI